MHKYGAFIIVNRVWNSHKNDLNASCWSCVIIFGLACIVIGI